MMRTPSLSLRNHLAEIILTALGDPAARRQLDAQDFAWLGEATEEQAAIVRARARRASEALAAAAALFDAGLYFEVHELLEPYWTRAAGAERQALQGLIQVAVAFQHRDNGNVEGARSLLVDGSARLREGRLSGLALDRFAAAAGAAAARVDDAAPPFPRTRTA